MYSISMLNTQKKHTFSYKTFLLCQLRQLACRHYKVIAVISVSFQNHVVVQCELIIGWMDSYWVKALTFSLLTHYCFFVYYLYVIKKKMKIYSEIITFVERDTNFHGLMKIAFSWICKFMDPLLKNKSITEKLS